jgi:hypothetical protein
MSPVSRRCDGRPNLPRHNAVWVVAEQFWQAKRALAAPC